MKPTTLALALGFASQSAFGQVTGSSNAAEMDGLPKGPDLTQEQCQNLLQHATPSLRKTEDYKTCKGRAMAEPSAPQRFQTDAAPSGKAAK